MQNYVSQRLSVSQQRIHYICPPPSQLAALMRGLRDVGSRALAPLLRGAIVSFGFVFVHPFEDGNGRIHRYLLHDGLARAGVVPPRTILPVSAVIKHRMNEYFATLDRFSAPLVEAASYGFDDQQVLALENGYALADWWRFPDLTDQVEFFGRVLEETISESLPRELMTLQSHDQARVAIQNIVDMPDRKLDELLLLLMHSSNGRAAHQPAGV